MERYRGQVIRTKLPERDDHFRKIRARKERTDIGKYSFVHRTNKLWNQLPVEALETFPYRSNIYFLKF